ncbi:MAG: hypothetical protein GF416_02975 [Candidatus Altiarchaeales archaeon]|nr:hypothetical protein [Candidatus Altiarchaeales archaeon]
MRIAAGLYVLFGLGFLAILLFSGDDLFKEGIVFMVVFLFGFAAIVVVCTEALVRGLRRDSFWAWIISLVVLGIYAPSLYFPLALLGILGLVWRSSRERFLNKEGVKTGSLQPGDKRMLLIIGACIIATILLFVGVIAWQILWVTHAI